MSDRRFDIEMTPFANDAGWAGIDVAYTANFGPVTTDQVLLKLPKIVASVPGAPYEASDIRVSDAAGALELTEGEGESGPMGAYRHFYADRTVDGEVRLEVRAPVREIDLRTPVGPLFDLRREPLGLFGAGISFVPIPPSDEREYDFSLTWQLEAGVTAVSSRGSGDEVRRWRGSSDTIERCLFGAGTPRISPEGSKNFGIHAYSDVPFDLDALSGYLGDIHAYMTDFFEEDEASYHVLVRRNPDKGSGGTSFPSSFAFGYSPTTEVDEEDLRSLLAHEMVHNWPTLDEEWEVASWYSEGTAEFYSLVLPWRAGLLSAESLAEQLSTMYSRYDTNIRRTLSYPEAAELFWADLRAQTVPYGRGIQYLVRVDSQLREASNEATSLDDIVLDILRAQRRGEKVLTEGWLERIEAVIGESVRDEYRAMFDGEPIPAPERAFQGVFEPVAITAPEHNLGFDIDSFNTTPRLITGLVPGSAAEGAGLREGDELVTRRFSNGATRDGTTPFDVAVMRDGVEETIRYQPRGPEVPTTKWVVGS
ncbi:hypothetical protein QBL02_03835 [Leucobacter sp. UT-8R-CII-1-4]|uniref:hypothetical protein n=1 Tax=Leucobacter sp. UT-8R-CII-1-4 TaxID=3040075 RepID=UPI0024A9264E|nr:hypothetical protein [Leucobacter sp. UT-8R-CII-1-4]MDI6022671.1 hypothetical protein [Leucobacter sp. UT-8R-CII-1-4]